MTAARAPATAGGRPSNAADCRRALAAYLADQRKSRSDLRDEVTRLRLCRDLYDTSTDRGGKLSILPEAVTEALRTMPADEREYLIATSYALMMDADERQRLGVFLTPPSIVDALLKAMIGHGLDLKMHRVIDPSAGGAAFVVPLARRMLAETVGQSAQVRLMDLQARLHGLEIEGGLGHLANHMVTGVIQAALGTEITETESFGLIRQADALESGPLASYDAVIGNPPYGRLSALDFARWKERYPEIARNGQLNWYAIFVRRSLDFLRPGGLLGFVLPTSFVGSSSYESFRRVVCSQADVVRIDHIDQREGLFISVTQDCCLLILRKFKGVAKMRRWCQLGYLNKDGVYVDGGGFDVATDGSPWRMSCGRRPRTRIASQQVETTLREQGWVGRVGSVVPHRNQDMLLSGRCRVSDDEQVVRVIWSKAITPDGRFDPARMDGLHLTYARCAKSHPGLITKPSLLIQRTSNKLQRRRVNAAVLPNSFLDGSGILAENHVVVLCPSETLADSDMQAWADLLSSEKFDSLFKERSGTVTVSVRLLMQIAFPADWVPVPKMTSPTVSHEVRDTNPSRRRLGQGCGSLREGAAQ